MIKANKQSFKNNIASGKTTMKKKQLIGTLLVVTGTLGAGSYVYHQLDDMPPPLDCSDIESIESYKSLGNTKESNIIFKNVINISKKCNFNQQQVNYINSNINRAIKESNKEEQRNFYKSILFNDVRIKENFIDQSLAFSLPEESRSFKINEDYITLGSSISLATLTETEQDNFNKIISKENESYDAENELDERTIGQKYRIISTGKSAYPLLFELEDSFGANSSTTTLTMHDLKINKKIGEFLLYQSGSSYGTGAYLVDSAFILDSMSQLRYIFSIHANGNTGTTRHDNNILIDCIKEYKIYKVDSNGIAEVKKIKENDTNCNIFDTPHNIITTANSLAIIDKIHEINLAKTLLNYVNFTTKDSADVKAVRNIQKNSPLGLAVILESLKDKVRNVDLPSSSNTLDHSQIKKLTSEIDNYINNIDWVLKSSINNKKPEQVSHLISLAKAKVNDLKTSNKEIISLSDKTSLINSAKALNINLFRGLNYKDDHFIPINDTHHAYVAMDFNNLHAHPTDRIIIIHSNKNLFNGSSFIKIIATENPTKTRWSFGGFSAEISQYTAEDITPSEYYKLISSISEKKKYLHSNSEEVKNKTINYIDKIIEIISS